MVPGAVHEGPALCGKGPRRTLAPLRHCQDSTCGDVRRAATELGEKAMAMHSRDNISVIILSFKTRKHHRGGSTSSVVGA